VNHDSYESATVREEEPQIVRVARHFDEAQRELQMLHQQREKISIAAQEAQQRLNEAAAHLRALIDEPAEEKLHKSESNPFLAHKRFDGNSR
jgi:predicted transcriptional regulator